MTTEQALKLADELEDLAALLTQRAEKIRKAAQSAPSRYSPLVEAIDHAVPQHAHLLSDSSDLPLSFKRWLP